MLKSILVLVILIALLTACVSVHVLSMLGKTNAAMNLAVMTSVTLGVITIGYGVFASNANIIVQGFGLVLVGIGMKLIDHVSQTPTLNVQA